MIQLNNDSLVFQLSNGDNVPCSVERFTIELIGEAANSIDSELIRNAAHAVLHYFKKDLQRDTVTLAEFAEALEKVLHSLGLKVSTVASADEPPPVPSDLASIAAGSGGAFELEFFPRLRDTMRHRLTDSPRMVRFTGLRRCAKQLVGARRWSARCEQMSDQIVDFLRGCLTTEAAGRECGLVVQ
ncbi:MAG TPA: hypothetical protein VI454_16575 [Verrucomicrobiae bacterium]|jgi:hypothetical protein